MNFSLKYKIFRINSAILAVSQGLSVRSAASKFLIASATLQYHLKSPRAEKPGPEAVFTPAEEKKISDWIEGSAKRGSPKTSSHVLEAASKLLRVKFGASGNALTQGWFQQISSFVVDNPEYLEAFSDQSRVFTQEQCRM
jgi:hypothetical protein